MAILRVPNPLGKEGGKEEHGGYGENRLETWITTKNGLILRGGSIDL